MFDFTINVPERIAIALERIANALEIGVGPDLSMVGPVEYKHRKRGPEAILNYGNQERSWLKENAESLIAEKGLPPELQDRMLEETLKEYDQSVENQALDPYGDL
jgi:hypothetical protein